MYKKVKDDSFGLFNGDICIVWFTSNDSRENNMSKLNQEEYNCRISSNTLEYAKTRINSWYRKNNPPTNAKSAIKKERNTDVYENWLFII